MLTPNVTIGRLSGTRVSLKPHMSFRLWIHITNAWVIQEGQTKHIKMEETNPDVLDKVLCYVYKRDYQVDAKSAVTIHPEVYALADYLGMQPLKQIVKKKFSEALKEDWEVVSFTKALRTIYTTTPASDRGLRDAAKAHLTAHKKSLRNHKGFTDL